MFTQGTQPITMLSPPKKRSAPHLGMNQPIYIPSYNSNRGGGTKCLRSIHRRLRLFPDSKPLTDVRRLPHARYDIAVVPLFLGRILKMEYKVSYLYYAHSCERLPGGIFHDCRAYLRQQRRRTNICFGRILKLKRYLSVNNPPPPKETVK